MARYTIKQLNEDLKRDLARMPAPKKRVTGHKATQVHGEQALPKSERHRRERRRWKQDRSDEQS